jgi:hypothetical protein
VGRQPSEYNMGHVDINVDDPRESEVIYRSILHDIYILSRREPHNRDAWNKIEDLLDRCRFDVTLSQDLLDLLNHD